MKVLLKIDWHDGTDADKQACMIVEDFNINDQSMAISKIKKALSEYGAKEIEHIGSSDKRMHHFMIAVKGTYLNKTPLNSKQNVTVKISWIIEHYGSHFECKEIFV